MLDALQAGEEALRRARDELQLRVEERTADLRQTADLLKEQIAQRQRGEQQLRFYVSRLEMLQEIDRALLAAASPQAIASAALHHVRRLGACRRASITLFDFERAEGVVYAVEDEDQRGAALGPGTRVPLAQGYLEQLERGIVREVRDVLAMPPAFLPKGLATAGLRSVVNAPLISQGALIGTLNLGWGIAAGFSPDSVAIAREVATSIALALQQAQLSEQIERHAAELEQRVVQRTQELEAFTYSISHDLRVPLRAMDGFSAILLEQYGGRLDAEGSRLIGIIRSSALSMGELIDGLLAVSRVGCLEMAITQLDLRELAAGAFEELRALAAGRSVHFSVGELTPARGDGTMIRQVFVNLLSNAIKFTRRNDPAVIEIGEVPHESGVAYYVKDNGVGFDRGYRDKLFEVFQRLHAPDHFEGTGVGLAIVRRIVQRHGGQVWAEGQVDQGATFYFTLPGRGHLVEAVGAGLRPDSSSS